MVLAAARRSIPGTADVRRVGLRGAVEDEASGSSSSKSSRETGGVSLVVGGGAGERTRVGVDDVLFDS